MPDKTTASIPPAGPQSQEAALTPVPLILCVTSWFLICIGFVTPLRELIAFGGFGLLLTAVLAAITGHRTAFLTTFPIILIFLLSLAFPSQIANRSASKESMAVSNLRTLNTAEVTYRSSKGRYGTISELIDAGLIDSNFRGGAKAGYVFILTVEGEGEGYIARTFPESTNTGRWGYYSVPDAVVRYSADPRLAPTAQAGLPVQ